MRYIQQFGLAFVCGFVACSAQATERGQVRALLGMPGQDLTTPLLPGWYLQASTQVYQSDRVKDNSGNSPPVQTSPTLPGVAIRQNTEVRAQVLATRLTWLTEGRVGSGRVGVSATLPVVHTDIQTNLSATVPAPLQPTVNAALAAASADRAVSGDKYGMADLDVAPFIDWQGDESRVAVSLSVVAPTGTYDKNRIANPGAGKFWSVRPVVTLARVFESGFEMGLRTSFTMNARNKDTDYHSGSYLHSDGSVMYRVRDNLRLGASGYALFQTTDDTSKVGTLANGNKARVYALGPQLSWQNEDGDIGLEAKVLKEFGVHNRPEGYTSWLRFMMRLN